MSLIFINYRREDSDAYAGRIFDKLEGHFGSENIFMDIEHIAPGDRFEKVIQKNLDTAKVALVLIGKDWLKIRNKYEQRRLDEPDDWVTREIKILLQRKICVIPVLVGNATLPEAEALPESIVALIERNAYEIRSQHFGTDVKRLIEILETNEGIKPAHRLENPSEISSTHLDADVDRLIEVPETSERIKPTPSLENLSEPRPESNKDNPYCGIRPFKEEDSESFFGRDTFVDEYLRPAIYQQPIVFLHGDSGVGKTSVVFAKLVPELKKSNWKCVTCIPGSDPFYSLARMIFNLLNPEDESTQSSKKLKEKPLSEYLERIQKDFNTTNVLLIIDDFEEIYKTSNINESSTIDSQNPGYDFLNYLVEGINWLKAHLRDHRIVFLIVSTSYGQSKSIKYHNFNNSVDRESYIQLAELSKEDDLKKVIVEPAKKKGVSFEDDLVKIMLNDVTEKPGALPFLGSALRQLWNTKIENIITEEAYKALGGLSSLTEYADRFIPKNDSAYEKIVSQIFLQLINARQDTIDPESEKLYLNKVPIKEFEEEKSEIIRYLTKNRLLIISTESNEEFVEIPKPVLRNWPKLKTWLNNDLRTRLTFSDIEKRAEEWKQNSKHSNKLDSDRLLEDTEIFINENSQDFRISPLIIEFHHAGIKKREKDKLELEKERKKKANDTKIKKGLILSVSILLIGFIGYSINKEETQRQLENRNNVLKKSMYFSSGERTLLVSKLEKRNGNFHFGAKNYDNAESYFRKSREEFKDDPESLIYQNNSAAFAQGNYYTFVASVPKEHSEDIAIEMLRGIALAQDEINTAGGVYGKLLHIMIADDGNNPMHVQKIANYLINNNDENVLAVIGSNASEASIKAAEQYQDKLIMVSPTSFAIDIEEIKQPAFAINYIFLVVNHYSSIMPKLVEHIKDENKSINPVMLVCLDSKALDQNKFKDYLRNEKVTLAKDSNNKEIECDFGDESQTATNLRDIVDKAVKNGANSLFVAPHVSRIGFAIDVVRHIKNSSYSFQLYGSPTLYNATILEHGEYFVDTVLPAYWHPDVNVSKNHPFYQESINRWDNEDGVTWRTAGSYEAVYVLYEALKNADINGGSLETQRKKLQEQLAKEDFSRKGTMGEIKFDKYGQRKKSDSYLIEVACQSSDECKEGYYFKLIN